MEEKGTFTGTVAKMSEAETNEGMGVKEISSNMKEISSCMKLIKRNDKAVTLSPPVVLTEEEQKRNSYLPNDKK